MVNETEKIFLKDLYELREKVEKNMKFARSIFTVRVIKKGEKFTEENERSIRFGYGMHPKRYHEILNYMTNTDISKVKPLDVKYLKL